MMKRLSLLTISVLIAGTAAAQSLEGVNARKLLAAERHLVVARAEGGISVFDKGSRQAVVHWPTERPVRDVRIVGDTVYWVVENSKSVQIGSLGTGQVSSVEVPSALLNGPITRISLWRGGLFAHGETEFAYVDLNHLRARRPVEVLPRDVWQTVKQGVADSMWDGDTGLLLGVRRTGSRRASADPAERKEIGMYTAWSSDRSGEMRLLGAYTASLVQFRDARGPRVQFKMGSREIDVPYGTADVGNLRLGPEGLYASGLNEVYVVPFYHDNWAPQRVRTAVKPRYSDSLSYHQESAWWTDGYSVYRADLEDGSTEVFSFKEISGSIRSVEADGDGAWIATASGIRRIELDSSEASTHRYVLSAKQDIESLEQDRLMKLAQSAVLGGQDVLTSFLHRASGKQVDLAGQVVDEAELGDLLVAGDQIAVYLGGGKVLISEGGVIGVRDINLKGEVRVLRVLARSPMPVALPPSAPAQVPPRRPVTQPGSAPTPSAPRQHWLTSVFPLGLNRPKTALGHGGYVRVSPGSQFDRPYRDEHQRLLQIAQSYLGTPYRWGGNSRSGIDCSGFVTAVYREVGISLPRHSQDIGRVAKGKVVNDELHFGDVLVFQNPKHVAIYIGNGRTIETVRGGVGYSSIYRRTQAIVRRFL
jgi:cell wall-associated NlpC family hydrolase